MTKNKISPKNNNDSPLNMIETARSKVQRIKGSGEHKKPASDPIVNIFKPEKLLTYEQISERAKLIWQNRGCIPGEDERNWNEAESQLKVELGIY